MAWTNPRTWVATDILTAAQLNTDIRDNEDFLKENILLEAPTELTIAAAAVTATKSYHKIDTAADAATDDLETIAGVADGRILILRAEHTDRTVVLKDGVGNLILGADISLNDTSKHVALICDTAGNLHLLYSARDVTFLANAFQYPAPGTDWTPKLEGAGLAADKANKKVWIPLNFLKAGDAIISYYLSGDAIENTALTLDCKLVKITLADPITTTDPAGGDIVQIDADGDFHSLATLTALEIVAAQYQYALEIEATTTGTDSIIVMGAEVLVRRLV